MGRGAYSVLVGETCEKEPLIRPRHRWEDNIKMNLRKMRWGMDLIDLAHDRDRWQAFVNTVVNLLVQ